MSTPYVTPTTPLELHIAAIWSELLGIDQIGLNDDFLALGGDSLQAMQMVNRLNKAFGVDLPAMAILSAATIAEMVELVHASLRKALSDEAWMLRLLKPEELYRLCFERLVG